MWRCRLPAGCIVVLAILGSLSSAAGQVNWPQVVADGEIGADPYRQTGIIGTYESYGSGVAAVSPRLVLSCAHVTFSFDYLLWTSGAEWHRAHHTSDLPTGGQLLNGYFYWNSYASAVRNTTRRYTEFNEAREFDNDFVAYFSYGTDLAGGSTPAAVWADGAPELRSSVKPKLVTGYPMGRYEDEDGHEAEFLQHRTELPTPLFNEFRSLKKYFTVYDIAETGSGNSGGPVWTTGPDGTYRVAGILVSGQEVPEWNRSMVGVHAISPAGWRLIDSALQASGGTEIRKSFPVTQAGAAIPDGRTLTRTFKVSGLPKTVNRVHLSLAITHTDRRDLYIRLRAPGNRTMVVYSGLLEEEYPELPQSSFPLQNEPMPYFHGFNPNGTWTLTVEDEVSNQITGNFISAEIAIDAR